MPYASKEAKKEWRKSYNATHREERNAYMREWFNNHPRYMREKYRGKYKPGWPRSEWRKACEALSATTRCQSCKGEYVKLQRDHCHESRLFRGILCSYCNTLLGAVEFAMRDQDRLAQVLKYLKNWEKRSVT